MRTGLRQRICIGARKRIPGGGDRRATLAYDAPRRRPKDRVQEGLTFQPPDISRSFLTVRDAWKNGDWLVVCPVTIEPVSTSKFPANREKNREFSKIAEFGALETINNAVVTGLPVRIPYSTEQGIILAEQGLLTREQGIISDIDDG
jgi:hypothetical protein